MNTILLDIDGVLNHFDHDYRKPDESALSGMSHLGFPIVWYPSVLERLVGFHDDGLAEIRWLTTWEDEANTLLQNLLGVDRTFEVAGRDNNDLIPREFTWWKECVYNNEYTKSIFDKVVWIDDELDKAYVNHYSISGHRLIVNPQPALTHKHLDDIERFLTS